MVGLPRLGDGNCSIVRDENRRIQAEDEDQAQDNTYQQHNRANRAVILQGNSGWLWFVEIPWCKHICPLAASQTDGPDKNPSGPFQITNSQYYRNGVKIRMNRPLPATLRR
jgi:hypothetical protein